MLVPSFSSPCFLLLDFLPGQPVQKLQLPVKPQQVPMGMSVVERCCSARKIVPDGGTEVVEVNSMLPVVEVDVVAVMVPVAGTAALS